MSKINKKIDKEFRLSSWAINNKTTIYVLMFLILYLGITSYFTMPRENFPEINETKIYISSVYPGNTAEDIEKLITNPLEDKLKSVSNVVEIISTSQEDYSIITVEFDENIPVEKAKQKVKDEIDQEVAGEDWPTFNGAKVTPNVFELSMSEEVPILNINISGNYPVSKLKEFGEYLQDEIEDLSEIKKVKDKELLKGMQLINDKFKNTLTQKGLTEIEVKEGDDFDAEIHEAITQIPAPSDKLKGKVIDAVEKGYKLGEKIIRYPKVVIGQS